MSNIRQNLIAEFEKIGVSPLTFTLAELQSKFEHDGIWLLNGQKYDSKHIKTIFANFSIGPGHRVGESVKRGQSPLFIKHPGRGVYSICSDTNLSSNSYKEQLSTACENGKKINKNNDLIAPSIDDVEQRAVLANNHSDVFAKNILGPNSESWAGGNVQNFANYLLNNGIVLNLSEYPAHQFNRFDLFAYVNDLANSTLSCCVAICAWGGMYPRNSLAAFSGWSYWEDIATRIRSGKITRTEAYHEFRELRKAKKLKGLGPAYFTKIIYFLSKGQHRGYIMDQWTARSCNLLLNKRLISLSNVTLKSGKIAYVVSDKNSSEYYEYFCQFIEKLAEIYKTTPDLIEMSLFSQGYGRGRWRNYVIACDSYLYS